MTASNPARSSSATSSRVETGTSAIASFPAGTSGRAARRPRELVESRRAASLKALAILDRELASRSFIAGDFYTIADISLFAYTSRAHEANLPLGDFANIDAWIERIKAQPGFLAKTYPYSIDPHSAGELP